jgi:MFS family permease
MPAQQASINDLVTRAELSRAVALGAVAFNVARAVGPALAGAVAALFSTGSALVASALFFVVMVFALRRLPRHKPATHGIPETLFSGIESGLRYVRHSPPMRALIVRNVSFSLCASALWALLPVIARDQLGLGGGEELQRHLGIQQQVLRRHHDAHTAAPEQAADLILAVEHGALRHR